MTRKLPTQTGYQKPLATKSNCYEMQDHMPAIWATKSNGKPQIRVFLEFTPAYESLAQKKTQ